MSQSYGSQRIDRSTTPSPAPIHLLHAGEISGSSGDAIASVPDALGSGPALVQAAGGQKPIMGMRLGRKALKFTQASATELASAAGGIAGAAPHTMFAVYFNRKSLGAYAPIASFGPSGGITSALGLGFTTGTTIWAGGSGAGAGDTSPTSSLGRLGQIQIVAKVYTGTTAELWVNGQRVAAPENKTYNVGSAAFGYGTPWIAMAACPDVDLLAGGHWNVAMTAAQLRAWFRWFAREFGLQTPITIIGLGDSIMLGLKSGGAAYTPPAQLQRLLARPTHVINMGQSGVELATLITSARVQADVFAQRAMGTGIAAIVHAGTNDNESAHATGAQILSMLASYYTALHGAGVARVIVDAILPRSPGAAAVQKDIVNNALRAASPGIYFDAGGFVDLEEDEGLADNNSDDSYDHDEVEATFGSHPNMKGSLRMATMWAEAIRPRM